MHANLHLWTIVWVATLTLPAARAQFGPPVGGPTSAPIEAAPNPWDALPQFERLTNELRICVIEDHALPLVSVQLWFGVGSSADHPSRSGLCHVVTTLLEQRDDASLRRRALGVAATAATHRDAVCFANVLHPALVERVIDLEAARLRACFPAGRSPEGVPRPAEARATTAAELEAARNAAAWTFVEEFERFDGPLERRAAAALFGDHPYNDPPAFVAEGLRDAAPAYIDEFIARWFTPGNATLFIIGDVSEVRILDYAKRQFEKIPYRDMPRRAEPAPLAAEELRLEGVPWPYAGVDFVFLTPPLGAFDNAAIAVLMQRLCNPVDGVLSRAARGAGVPPPRFRHEAWRHCGMLWLSLDEPPLGSGAAHEALLRAALAQAAEQLTTEIELNRARALATAAVQERRAAFRDRAARMAEFELVAGDILLAEYEAPQIARVSVDDVRAAAAFLLDTRRVVIERTERLWCECEQRYPVIEDAADAALPQLVSPLCAPWPAWPDPGARLTQMANIGPVERLGAYGVATPHVVTRTLPNGVTAIVCRVPGMERACVRTVLDGLPYSADVANALMRIGSSRRPAEQTHDYLMYHGIDLHARIEGRGPCLNAVGPAALVPQMLEVQCELLRWPQRDAAKNAARITALEASPTSVGTEQDLLLTRSPRRRRLPFGSNYLPPSAEQIERALAALDGLGPPRIIVVGEVEPSVVLDAITAAWSDWSRPAAAEGAGASATAPAVGSAAAAPAEPTLLIVPRSVLPRGVLYSVVVPALLRRDAQASQTVDFIRTLLDASPPREPRFAQWMELGGERPAEKRLRFKAHMGDEPVAAATIVVCARIGAMRDGAIPVAESELALALTDGRRWLRLESADAITDALEQTDGDPWMNARVAGDATALLRTIREQAWIGRVQVFASSCDAAVRERLKNLPWAKESVVPEAGGAAP